MTEDSGSGGLTALADGYLLRDPDTGTVYVAFVNTAQRSGGVMPHLVADTSVEITERFDDGSVSIVIRHQDGTNQMDQQLRAFPVPDPLGSQLLAAAGLD